MTRSNETPTPSENNKIDVPNTLESGSQYYDQVFQEIVDWDSPLMTVSGLSKQYEDLPDGEAKKGFLDTFKKDSLVNRYKEALPYYYEQIAKKGGGDMAQRVLQYWINMNTLLKDAEAQPELLNIVEEADKKIQTRRDWQTKEKFNRKKNEIV